MTPEELRQKFRNTFNCYADSDNVVMAMDEDAAIDFAEAYKEQEIKELKKSLDKWKAMWESRRKLLDKVTGQTNEMSLEIKELKRTNNKLNNKHSKYCLLIDNQKKEIKELKDLLRETLSEDTEIYNLTERIKHALKK